MRVTLPYAESIRCELPARAVNHTGSTRGRLTFLWPTTERHGDVVKWVARCSCGNYALVGRFTRSCGCLNAKVGNTGILSEAAVFAIRSSSERGTVLAAAYGVSKSTISNVRTGRRYSAI